MLPSDSTLKLSPEIKRLEKNIWNATLTSLLGPPAWLSEEGTAFQIRKCFKRLWQEKPAACSSCSSYSVHVVGGNFIVCLYWDGEILTNRRWSSTCDWCCESQWMGFSIEFGIWRVWILVSSKTHFSLHDSFTWLHAIFITSNRLCLT